jgi:hypothetical protein
LRLLHNPVQENNMYASLIGAGVSQLWDLLRSQTQSSNSSTPSSGTTATAPSASGTTPNSGTGRVGGLSSDLNTLMLDLQSGGTTSSSATASGTADPTTTVANDLQSVFGDLSKASAAHGHHHHHQAGADAQSASSGSATTGATGAQQSATDPFQNLAASLLAYTKGQGLAASQSASTSLTA